MLLAETPGSPARPARVSHEFPQLLSRAGSGAAPGPALLLVNWHHLGHRLGTGRNGGPSGYLAPCKENAHIPDTGCQVASILHTQYYGDVRPGIKRPIYLTSPLDRITELGDKGIVVCHAAVYFDIHICLFRFAFSSKKSTTNVIGSSKVLGCSNHSPQPAKSQRSLSCVPPFPKNRVDIRPRIFHGF